MCQIWAQGKRLSAWTWPDHWITTGEQRRQTLSGLMMPERKNERPKGWCPGGKRKLSLTHKLFAPQDFCQNLELYRLNG